MCATELDLKPTLLDAGTRIPTPWPWNTPLMASDYPVHVDRYQILAWFQLNGITYGEDGLSRHSASEKNEREQCLGLHLVLN
jgi:hypothetical protein